jgi:hypothetical protein
MTQQISQHFIQSHVEMLWNLLLNGYWQQRLWKRSNGQLTKKNMKFTTDSEQSLNLMTHCLMVVHKIDGQISENDDKKLQSYKQVLWQTLSLPLVGVWDQVVTKFNKDHEDPLLLLLSCSRLFCMPQH